MPAKLYSMFLAVSALCWKGGGAFMPFFNGFLLYKVVLFKMIHGYPYVIVQVNHQAGTSIPSLLTYFTQLNHSSQLIENRSQLHHKTGFQLSTIFSTWMSLDMNLINCLPHSTRYGPVGLLLNILLRSADVQYYILDLSCILMIHNISILGIPFTLETLPTPSFPPFSFPLPTLYPLLPSRLPLSYYRYWLNIILIDSCNLTNRLV